MKLCYWWYIVQEFCSYVDIVHISGSTRACTQRLACVQECETIKICQWVLLAHGLSLPFHEGLVRGSWQTEHANCSTCNAPLSLFNFDLHVRFIQCYTWKCPTKIPLPWTSLLHVWYFSSFLAKVLRALSRFTLCSYL